MSEDTVWENQQPEKWCFYYGQERFFFFQEKWEIKVSALFTVSYFQLKKINGLSVFSCIDLIMSYPKSEIVLWTCGFNDDDGKENRHGIPLGMLL